jgi:hypothetical protein
MKLFWIILTSGEGTLEENAEKSIVVVVSRHQNAGQSINLQAYNKPFEVTVVLIFCITSSSLRI